MPESRVGGARKGAGRKPQGEVAMVTRAFVIRKDQEARLQDQARKHGVNLSAYLRKVIDTVDDWLPVVG